MAYPDHPYNSFYMDTIRNLVCYFLYTSCLASSCVLILSDTKQVTIMFISYCIAGLHFLPDLNAALCVHHCVSIFMLLVGMAMYAMSHILYLIDKHALCFAIMSGLLCGHLIQSCIYTYYNFAAYKLWGGKVSHEGRGCTWPYYNIAKWVNAPAPVLY